jgi:hypothetical protein
VISRGENIPIRRISRGPRRRHGWMYLGRRWMR